MKRTINLWLVALLLVGCAAGAPSDAAPEFGTAVSNQTEPHEHAEGEGAAHEHILEDEATGEVQVALVASEIVIGPNRFAVGLLDADGSMIHDADVHLHYFDLSQEPPVVESEVDAERLQTPDGQTTIYAHERSFDRAGDWGVEIQAQRPDGTTALKRIGFVVLADSPSIAPGEAAPRIHTPTASDVDDDLAKLTSAPEPNPAFYQLGLDDALASGKPTLLLFATPAFCQTRFCGPDYEIVSAFQQRHADALNFIHVEVFTGLPNPAENDWQMAPAMAAFGLNTEPWLYLIDDNGQVVYRIEGLFTAEELERHVQPLLQAAGSK
ncbi:MAG TPA: hypothetical protein VER55_02860 [Ardenticatenaceae bacterium]|nr:hypothetical protein [Ardenticatenaceae bacterium]